MPIIKINFDKKSIQKAINTLNRFSKNTDKLLYGYLNDCIKWIRNRADQILLTLPMDGNIIADIMNGWVGEVSSRQAKLINTNEKAVFVEFGVGKIAEDKPHPNAQNANYEYNIPTEHKNPITNSWTFYPDNKIGIDLHIGYYKSETNKNGQEIISTTGSPASLYLFNAIEDFKSQNIYKKLWENAIERTLKA